MDLTDTDRSLIEIIQCGLPLSARPYAEVGACVGLGEHETIARIDMLVKNGIIKKMGVIVRHHELGYRANGMVVWDVPDADVVEVGRKISNFEFVTLCYRRVRRPPAWNYNLFCMIHGRDRDTVLRNVACLVDECSLHDVPHEILFSHRRFKQGGALYLTPAPAEASRQLLA